MTIAGDGTPEATGVVRATIDRVVVLGFEVRVELTNAATGGPFIAQITRGDAEALGLKQGDTVYVRATRIPALPEQTTARNDADVDEIRVSSS
jgi:sulfate transport system ATP-binding protein